MEARRRRQIAAVFVVLNLHLAIDLGLVLLLLSAPGGLGPDTSHLLFLACLAWPMTQASLVALWAAVSRTRSYLRFLFAVLGLVCAWLLLVLIVPRELHDPECASYAAMFIVQALVILLGVAAARLAWGQIARARGRSERDSTRRLQYDLATLLLWTVSLSVALGLGRLVFTGLGWTGGGVVEQEYFFFSMVFGVGNAGCALLVLASLLGKSWRIVRVFLGLVAVGILGALEPLLLTWLFGDTGGIEMVQFVVIAASQAVFLYATLVPLRLAGCFGATTSRTEPAAVTVPESGNPFAT
jgi:hypothetical protein